MSEKHYPYIGGSFERIVFDGDGSVWVPESENAKLQDENARLRSCLGDDAENARQIMSENAKLREQVTQLQDDWESERDYADQMEAKEKRAVAENAKLRELFYEAWEWMQRARYDRSIRANEMDEIGVKAIKMGFPDYELGIEARYV